MLEQVFTTNIDGLDHQLGLPANKILAVHGTLTLVRCEFCKHKMPPAEFQALLRANIKDISASDASAPAKSSVIKCRNSKCGRACVKPTAVLFGAKVDNSEAKRVREHAPLTDFLFVVGTSLAVEPVPLKPSKFPSTASRIVVNREPPSSDHFAFGGTRDHEWRGDCEAMFVALAARLGWLPELAEFRGEWSDASRALFDKARQDAM
jgi:NAD-dependent SIR2 family protein deacetylase